MTAKKASTRRRPAKRPAALSDSESNSEFASVVTGLSGKPGVTSARMFGSSALKVNGKVFAMLVKGRLVVKLPQERVTALIGSGVGEHFDPGHGRIMREWVAVRPPAYSKTKWRNLAEEAKDFVASGN